MWQKLMITDLTRMRGDRVCIAGVTPKRVVLRPELPDASPIREKDLFKNKQIIIRPRAVLNIHLEPMPCHAPHSEDHIWLEWERTECFYLADDPLWKTTLRMTACPSAAAIFEADILENKKLMPGTGARSLGTIRPRSINYFEHTAHRFDAGKFEYRLGFTDESGQTFEDIPITDLALRCYVDHLRTRQAMSVYKITTLMSNTFSEGEIWLRLGLTRPFHKTDKEGEWCFLQVNGIYTFPDYLDGRCFADFL